jgi:hypothetical protein
MILLFCFLAIMAVKLFLNYWSQSYWKSSNEGYGFPTHEFMSLMYLALNHPVFPVSKPTIYFLSYNYMILLFCFLAIMAVKLFLNYWSQSYWKSSNEGYGFPTHEFMSLMYLALHESHFARGMGHCLCYSKFYIIYNYQWILIVTHRHC